MSPWSSVPDPSIVASSTEIYTAVRSHPLGSSDSLLEVDASQGIGRFTTWAVKRPIRQASGSGQFEPVRLQEHLIGQNLPGWGVGNDNSSVHDYGPREDLLDHVHVVGCDEYGLLKLI